MSQFFDLRYTKCVFYINKIGRFCERGNKELSKMYISLITKTLFIVVDSSWKTKKNISSEFQYLNFEDVLFVFLLLFSWTRIKLKIV